MSSKRKASQPSVASFFKIQRTSDAKEAESENVPALTEEYTSLASTSTEISAESDVPVVAEESASLASTSTEISVVKIFSKLNERRFYNKAWEKKYTWLYEDKSRGGAFCRLCERFMANDANILQKTGGVFITLPFTSYKKALGKDGKLEKHEHSSSHTKSTEMEKLRLNALKNPVNNQILCQSEEQKENNRKALSLLSRGVYFLVKEEIPHTTKYERLINNLLVKCNQDIADWKERQSERSTYCTKNTASELLQCIGEVLSSKIKMKISNKKFSLMADESTSRKNELQLSVCLRYVENNHPTETFVSLVKIPNGLSETIANAIDLEIRKQNLDYNNLVAFGFDGASNFSGNTAGVRKKLSQKAGRDIPYIHCRAHVLSLAAASCRNKNPKVKRFFHILKDVYKLFSQSAKRENILHEIQAVINDPILKVPECVEVRWLSHYKIVNAVKRSYSAILLACENIHKEGADLASSAGGILLEMRNKSFFIILIIMDEVLKAMSNLSKVLQKVDVSFSSLILLIESTNEHLKDIANACNEKDETSWLKSNIFDLMKKPLELCDSMCFIEDENPENTFKGMHKYILSVTDEISCRFNDKAINLMQGASYFESIENFLTISEKQVENLCQYFVGIDSESVIADIKSFTFFLKAMVKSGDEDYSAKESPVTKLFSANIGYTNLISLCEALLCLPVSTASVERTFSTMNRVLTKLRARMDEETLHQCMLVSIEGDDDPKEDFFQEVVTMFAVKKPRRIRLI